MGGEYLIYEVKQNFCGFRRIDLANFLHAGTYLLKLKIDDVILYGRVKACPCMPKEAIKT